MRTMSLLSKHLHDGTRVVYLQNSNDFARPPADIASSRHDSPPLQRRALNWLPRNCITLSPIGTTALRIKNDPISNSRANPRTYSSLNLRRHDVDPLACSWASRQDPKRANHDNQYKGRKKCSIANGVLWPCRSYSVQRVKD